MDRDYLNTVLRRAARLRKREIDILSEAASRGDAGLEHRVLLASSTAISMRAREEHLLWIVHNAPALDFGSLAVAAGFWGFLPERLAVVRSMWETALEAHPLDSAVVRNSSASLLREDPDFGEALYHCCQNRQPLNPEWYRGLGELYEYWVDINTFPQATRVLTRQHFSDRPGLARLAASSYMAAFVLMGMDGARLELVWPMRQCAAVAGDTRLRDILRSLDRDAELARER